MNFDYVQEKDINKKNVVFIHGFSSSKAFVNRLKRLKRNFNIIALSLPSNLEANNNELASIKKFAEYVKNFLNYLQLDHFYILGHSLGAAIVSYLHDYPGVEKFILCSPLHPLNQFNNEIMHQWLLPKNFEEAKDSIINLVYDPNTWQGKEDFVAKTNLRIALKSNAFFQKMVEEEISNITYLRSEINDNYQKMKNKIHLIAGTDDLYIQWKFLKQTADQLNLPTSLIANCGHVPLFEHPLKVKEIIEKII